MVLRKVKLLIVIIKLKNNNTMTVLNCEIPIIYEALIYVDLVSQLNHQCVVNKHTFQVM